MCLCVLTLTCEIVDHHRNYNNNGHMCFQVDAVKNLSESFAYVSFGIVLFVWEVLPISVVVIFFRVKRQSSAVVSKYDR